MARETLLICDFDSGSCRKPAKSYRLWIDGDRQAWAVDLCEEHSALMLAIAVDVGKRVDLPSKPRKGMEVTTLQATSRTAHLKKKG